MNGEINKRRNKFLISTVCCVVLIIAIGFVKPANTSFVAYQAHDNESSSVRILIVGDLMLDRNVANVIDRIGFEKYFSGVKDLIRSADIAIANLEGAITPYPSVTKSLVSKELVFTFDPSMAPALADLGFDILGLANNHSYNFGKSGLEMTRRYIGSSGMFYYGDPFNKDEISSIITKNGVKIGLVGFHEFYYTNFDKVFSEIARLKKEVDVVIVTPHWGIEYEKEPTEKMVQWAHSFIDSGADAVIGAHPHIVGASEVYKEKKIYYSLGNFAFDQYFSKATMEGLGIVIDIDKAGGGIDIKYGEIPIKVERDGPKASRE